ncbi:S1C family serine protease, partial [Cellulomonas citrea]|uniref:S1C family serine protease n=1 Tax=Cellulomonas citrea TaxID=1909423 RepID=UPI001358B880
ALIAGGVAMRGVAGAQTTTTSDTALAPQEAPFGAFGDQQGGGDPRGGAGGSPQGRDGSQQGLGGLQPGSGDGTTGGSAQAPATEASAAQQVGVVTVVSTLGYENGTSAGTGMVLTSDGEVLTNNHVVAGATSIEVTVETTGATYRATVVGTDATHDVAVLRLQGASGLTPVRLDSDGGVRTGDTVTAIGNAEGTGTLVAATGDVVATDQTMTANEQAGESETLHGLIEFSADVVSGDSGGPVLDSDGEVVGITTAASSGTGATVAYAIDIADALTIAHQIDAGTASDGVVIGYPAFLGVQVASDLSAQPGLGGSGSIGGSGSLGTTTGGASIAGVIEGTPAAKAGLAAGDTITAVDGTTISSGSQLSSVLGGHAPGDRVRITWVSGSTGASRSATVRLVEGPAA